MKNAHRFTALSQRFDAGESASIQRALLYVEKEVTTVAFREARSLRFVPMIPGIPEGAQSYSWIQMTPVGEARRTSDRGRDLPRVDVANEEFISPIVSYGCEYGYTTQELREIAMSARSGFAMELDRARAATAIDVMARRIDRTVAFGDENHPTMKGFLNNAAVAVTSAVGVWSGLTTDQLIAELNALSAAVINGSGETIVPDTILLPTAQHLLLSSRLIANTAVTVLEAFRNAMNMSGRPLEIVSWPLLDTANAARNGPRAVAYRRDPSIAGAIVPLPFEAQPVQAKSLEFVVPCEGRSGGAAVRRPIGIVYRDGI